eukprot:7254335-Lingulodinium_polyedra.AAC.1
MNNLRGRFRLLSARAPFGHAATLHGARFAPLYPSPMGVHRTWFTPLYPSPRMRARARARGEGWAGLG